MRQAMLDELYFNVLPINQAMSFDRLAVNLQHC